MTRVHDRDIIENDYMLGDAMDMMGRDDIDDDEVLASARFGITEMEDVLGDTLDEMGYGDE